MKELQVKNNPLNLRVFINHEPDLNLMPKDYWQLIISECEKQIEKDANTLRKRKEILQMR